MTNQHNTPALSLRTVQLSYGKVKVLRGINFDLHRGNITALVGPSGSGKTSVLMLASGLETPVSGQIRFQGERLDQRSEDELAVIRRDGIGVLFQAFHLHPSLTAQENAAMPLLFARRRDAIKVARQQLSKVGLGHRLDHFPSQLSGGEQQRVALVRAFINKPSLILADEPTGNLDTKTGDSVINHLFARIRETNAAALIVTHDHQLAKRCDSVLNLDGGRLVQEKS